MKQLSSRWVITVLVVPVLLILSLLIAGLDKTPPAEAASGKGFVQVGLTGAVNSVANSLGFQSLLLNVIAVRFSESTDPNLSEFDGSWQTVAVSPGATAGSIFPSLSFGGSFGPNGNSIGIGTARTEMQIDLAQLQNNVTIFNIGKIDAITYRQVELVLDSTNPGTVTPICTGPSSSAEGCIAYATQFPSSSTVIRYLDQSVNQAGILTVARNATTTFALAINIPAPVPPFLSTDKVTINPQICPVPLTGSVNCPFNLPTNGVTSLAGIVTGKVNGANNNGVVNAQLPGTSTIVSSARVDTTAARNYTMVLPAGTYDFVSGSGAGFSIDAQSGVSIPIGPAPELDFTVTRRISRPLSGSVVDTCTGKEISGATVQIYAPPTHIGSVALNCASPSPAATPAACECDNFSSGLPPAGCVIIASSSTSNLGAYPFSPSGTQNNAFSALPVSKAVNYGLMATASGYNGELLALKDRSGTLKCDGSGYKDDACSFSLQHGTLKVTADAGSPVPGNLNVMLNAEDQGTFNGEGVQMFTIPAGAQTANNVPISVPIQGTPFTGLTPAAAQTPAADEEDPTSADESDAAFVRAAKATPTPTGTPVVIGGAASYDLFASVQDLFGPAPQKVSGHTIAVLSAVPAPSSCATVTAPGKLTGLDCVGHGSVTGTINTVDQNTELVVAKDDGSGNLVDISSSEVPLINATQNFAVCAPADSYTVAHYEAQPPGTPIAISTATVTLTPPTTIANTAKNPCFGICSTGDTSTCLLCQPTSASINIP